MARTKKIISNTAVEATKRRTSQSISDGPIQLSTGVWVIVRPVSANLIADAQAGIEDPAIPMFPNPDKDNRLEPNPSHPDYLKEVQEVESERILAGLDVMIAMGVELVNEDGTPAGLPLGDHWIRMLRLLERQGRLNLSKFDFNDEIDLEFLYKKYVAVSAPDIQIISQATGITEEDVKRARAAFQGNEE